MIDTPSLRHSPVARVFPTLSLPAKSTKCNFDVTTVEVEAFLPGVETLEMRKKDRKEGNKRRIEKKDKKEGNESKLAGNKLKIWGKLQNEV